MRMGATYHLVCVFIFSIDNHSSSWYLVRDSIKPIFAHSAMWCNRSSAATPNNLTIVLQSTQE